MNRTLTAALETEIDSLNRHQWLTPYFAKRLKIMVEALDVIREGESCGIKIPELTEAESKTFILTYFDAFLGLTDLEKFMADSKMSAVRMLDNARLNGKLYDKADKEKSNA